MPPIRTTHKSRRGAIADVPGESSSDTSQRSPRRSQRAAAGFKTSTASQRASRAIPIDCVVVGCALPYTHQHPPDLQYYAGTDPNWRETPSWKKKAARPAGRDAHSANTGGEDAGAEHAVNDKTRSDTKKKVGRPPGRKAPSANGGGEKIGNGDDSSDKTRSDAALNGRLSLGRDDLASMEYQVSTDEGSGVPSNDLSTITSNSLLSSAPPLYEPERLPSSPASASARPRINFDDWILYPESEETSPKMKAEEEAKSAVAQGMRHAPPVAAGVDGGDRSVGRMRKEKPESEDDDVTERVPEYTPRLEEQVDEEFEEEWEGEDLEEMVPGDALLFPGHVGVDFEEEWDAMRWIEEGLLIVDRFLRAGDDD